MVTRDQNGSLRSLYKSVRLHVDSSWDGSFGPSVSFNTVPLVAGHSAIGDDPEFDNGLWRTDYTMDEFYDIELSGDNDRIRGFSPPPARKQQKVALSQMFKIAENGKLVRVDYPSKPGILNDAVVLTKKHQRWTKLWRQRKDQILYRMEHKEQFFQDPKVLFPVRKITTLMAENGYDSLSKQQQRVDKIRRSSNQNSFVANSPRSIVCHISGRRYTWVAMDWTLRNLAQDRDHIVIVASLPNMTVEGHQRSRSLSRSRSCAGTRSRSRSHARNFGGRHPSADPRTNTDYDDMQAKDIIKWSSGYDEKEVENKIKQTFEYILAITSSERALKISCEVVIGKTLDVLFDAVNIYTPDFLVSSTKRWARIDNMVVWKSRNLTDQLCTKFPVPTFVVPSKRMFEVELELQNQFPPATPPTKCFKSLKLDKSYYEKRKSVAGTKVPLIIETSPSVDSLATGYESDHDIEYDSDDSKSIRSSTSETTIKNRLHSFARAHRIAMGQRLDEVCGDNKLSYEERELKKVDIIIKTSLEFVQDIDNLSENEDVYGHGRSNSEDLDKIKRLFTGGAVKSVSASKKSMLDVVAPKSKGKKKSAHRTQKSESCQASPTQIKFAVDVKPSDGKHGFGNGKNQNTLHVPDYKKVSGQRLSLDRIPSYSVSNSKVRKESQDKSKESSGELRKVKSANNLEKVKSADLSTSSLNSGKKKKRGFFSFLKGGSSSNKVSSRRSSSGSEKSEYFHYRY